MYLYYEHHRDASGTVVCTEMRLSSFKDGTLRISHKNSYESMLKDICLPLMKAPPPSVRMMDERNWVWTYMGTHGVKVIENIKEVTRPINEVVCIEVEDLATQAMNHRVDLSKKRKKLRDEDFFYNHGQVQATPAMTKESIAAMLAPLLATTVEFLGKTQNGELKKLYRQAALRLHPDRNNGNGVMMSELNSLWRMYNA